MEEVGRETVQADVTVAQRYLESIACFSRSDRSDHNKTLLLVH